jgi:chromosome segregation ATPase
MFVTVLIAIGIVVVIFLVTGITLIYKGYTQTPDPLKVVAKDEYQKVQDELQRTKEEEGQLKLRLDSVAVRLQETKDKLLDEQKLQESLQVAQSSGQKQQELLSHMEVEKRFLAQKADAQAQEAIGVLNNLLAENEQLHKAIQEAENRVDPKDIAKLNTLNQTLREQIDQHLGKIKTLEVSLSHKEDEVQSKLNQADVLINNLSSQNQKLKEGLQQVTEKISTVEEEFQRANATQRDAQTQAKEAQEQLAAATDRMRELEKEINILREDKSGNVTHIQELENALAEHQKKFAALSETVKSQQANTQATSTAQVQWQEEKTGLEQTLAKLQSVNEELISKEKILLFQITKSRAQAQGLEKICAALKEQLDSKSI